jgi:hypothetical protein
MGGVFKEIGSDGMVSLRGGEKNRGGKEGRS